MDDALGGFGQQIDAYLAGNPPPTGVAPQDARRALGAVLFEAGAQANPGELPTGWDTLVADGLALLRNVTASQAHAGALPNANPEHLAVGGQFEIDAPALAYLRPGTETGRFVIARPVAKDISRLAGDDSGRIMFAAGTRFRVTRIIPGPADGQPVIHLEHPGPESATAPGGASTAAGEPVLRLAGPAPPPRYFRCRCQAGGCGYTRVAASPSRSGGRVRRRQWRCQAGVRPCLAPGQRSHFIGTPGWWCSGTGQ